MKTLKTILALASLVPSTAALAASTVHVYHSGPEGFDTRTVFVDDGREVIAFDAQFTPAEASKAIEFLRERTSNPIRYLVITHPNPDKFNGAEVFRQAGAKVIASKRTVESMPGVHAYKKSYFVQAGMFTEATYPKLPQVDATFADALELKTAGGGRIQLRELGIPGVSSNQTIALVPGAHAIVVGDLVHYRTHLWLEGGIVNSTPHPTLGSWTTALDRVLELAKPQDRIYGGRGESAPAALAIAEAKAYLKRAPTIVDQYLSSKDPKSPVDYSELTKRFEAEFPGYALGYLIQYGAYGLVLSRQK